MLIVLEGLDGAGKSTQVRLVSEYLSGKKSEFRYLHFPRFDTPVVGEMIAKFLRGDFGKNDSVHPMLVAHIFAEDRREAGALAHQWLSQGDTVLFDRYVYSNIAFQCAKLSDKRERDELRDWILNTEYEVFKIPRPDINIFLDVPIDFVDERLKENRQGDDRDYLQGKEDIHEADLSFQRRVREIYLEQCERDPEFIRIDCSDEKGHMLPPQKIFEMIKKEIDTL